ncbi:hypothetical protein Tco_0214077 [Tanacetum coccineum]
MALPSNNPPPTNRQKVVKVMPSIRNTTLNSPTLTAHQLWGNHDHVSLCPLEEAVMVCDVFFALPKWGLAGFGGRSGGMAPANPNLFVGKEPTVTRNQFTPQEETGLSLGKLRRYGDCSLTAHKGKGCILRLRPNINSSGTEIKIHLCFAFEFNGHQTTEAEYEAIHWRIEDKKGMGVKHIDSTKEAQNMQADALSKLASMSLFAYLTKNGASRSTWMTPIKEYLEKGTLPKEKRKGTMVERKSKIIRASGRDLVPEVILRTMEERRELAAIAEEKHKRKMEGYYKSKVWNTILRLRDLVYHSNEASRKEETGKLGPKWEGPYKVTEALGDGAYKLRDQEGNQLPRT